MKIVRGMKAVVLGCGAAGVSAVRFLLGQGVVVGVSDTGDGTMLSSEIRDVLEASGVCFEFGGHTGEFVTAADFVVPSPGVPLDAPILKMVEDKQIPVVGELGLAAGRFGVPVVAVTGSNGKTTVTALIGELLSRHFGKVFVGGNIGTPLLDCFNDEKSYRAVVLELSSFQLELVGDFRPDISLILNVTPDHLDRHHTLDNYLKAKLNVIKNQVSGDTVILGGDDPKLSGLRVKSDLSLFYFGTSKDCRAVVEQETVHLRSREKGGADTLFPLGNTSMRSSVNRLNAAAAILAAHCIGCSQKEIRSGLGGFKPPQHRMSDVAVIDGVRYINDSKATNVGALQAALAGCEEPVVLIAGGRDKQGDFHSLQQVVAAKVRHLVLLGEAAGKMEEIFAGFVRVTVVGSMEEAVFVAAERARAGDVVLLAPGCASFDMFTGYEHRGRVFTETVLEYEQGQMR